MNTTRVHIDRMVLHGFSPLDAARLRDAFAAALAEPQPHAASAAATHEMVRLTVRDAGSPEALGRAAARALLQASRS